MENGWKETKPFSELQTNQTEIWSITACFLPYCGFIPVLNNRYFRRGPRQWLECPQYTGTNHMPVYGGTNQVYAVTAGATVPAAFAGVHRNHHFDTRKRLHPLMHPLHPGIGLDYSSIYRKLQSSLFFHEKRDITALMIIPDIIATIIPTTVPFAAPLA